MAYPIDPSEGFVRTPSKYPHDAFGADTGGRVRPHTGLDTTPTVANARNRAVVSGVVTRVGYSQYVGNYVEIRDAKGRYWLTFHQRQNLVKPDAIVAENAVIGYTGNTGGSGALGSAKIGVHNHTSLCATQAAATRLITGQVRARYKNETTAQWAADRGLLDPWPIIRDGEKADAPATGGTDEPVAAPIEGDDMARIVENVETNTIWCIDTQMLRHETDRKYAEWSAKTLNPGGAIQKVSNNEFQSMVASLGIPRTAPDVLAKASSKLVSKRGMVWSAAKDYHSPQDW